MTDAGRSDPGDERNDASPSSPAQPPEGAQRGAEQPEGLPDARERRRAIQRAIRRREAPPPGLEELAMQVALRQSGLRWFVVLYGFGFVLEVLGFVVAESGGTRIRDGLLALAFLTLGYVQWQIGQRAKEAVDRWSDSEKPPRRATRSAPPRRSRKP